MARLLPVHDIGRVPIADVAGSRATAQLRAAPSGTAPANRAPNRTGLPDGLKAGVEAVSGLSLDRVRVHYASPEPARLDAHAFTRGSDIHLAPGQERHLPHEAWHVVQQAEGRVRPTLDIGGTQVNDDAGLEREADRFGESSMAHGRSLAGRHAAGPTPPAAVAAHAGSEGACAQRVIRIKGGKLEGEYTKKGSKDTKALLAAVDKAMGKKLRRGWKAKLGDWAADEGKTHKFANTKHFTAYLEKRFKKIDLPKKKLRPNFPKSSYKLAAIAYGIETGTDQTDMKPSEENLAMPHRFPYAAIQSSTNAFISGNENATDLDRWSGRLRTATVLRLKRNLPKLSGSDKTYYKKTIETQLKDFDEARDALKKSVAKGDSLDLASPVVQTFMKFTNALHGNIPDYGPHEGVNIQVSDRLHLHFDSDGTMTPGSLAAGSMTPTRVPKGVAYTSDDEYLVTTDGKKVSVNDLKKSIQQQLAQFNVGTTTIDEEELEDVEFD
ncbi:MAG TPA: DUF4157 domain-containing protein [Rhizomicrobium sp.]|nr:DUF4157 domain-containing protein [Rhizomicrobium sp.]